MRWPRPAHMLVLLGSVGAFLVGGGIAAYKAAELLRRLTHAGSSSPLPRVLMRLLFVSHSLPPRDRPLDNVGGIQRVAKELMQALEDHIAVGMRFHGLSLRSTSDGLQHVFVEHTAVYEAIAAGDDDLARELMHAHLRGSRDRLFAPKP